MSVGAVCAAGAAVAGFSSAGTGVSSTASTGVMPDAIMRRARALILIFEEVACINTFG